MEKILKNEKHQGPLVNHTSFRFGCNISKEEQNIQDYERHLTEIENSFDTSKEMQIRKKIAGRFSTEVAYETLTQTEFKTNLNNNLITALIPSRIDLSERQIEILSEQLEAVYGMNGYYVQVVDDVVGKRVGENAITANNINVYTYSTVATSSKIPTGVPLSAIPANTTWYNIRKGLIDEFGENIDAAWFSRAVAKECKETAILTLTMPTRFMADWIKNNYSHVIHRFATSLGFKCIEYTD